MGTQSNTFSLFFIKLALLFPLMCYSLDGSAQNSGYQIEVNIKNLPDGNAYLGDYYGGEQRVKDTVRATSGNIKFYGKDKLPEGLYFISFDNQNNSIELIINEDQVFEVTTDIDNLVGAMSVKGNTENEQFYTYAKQATALYENNETSPSLGALQQLKRQYIKAHPNWFSSALLTASQDIVIPKELTNEQGHLYYKQHYFDHIDFGDSRLINSPILKEKLTVYLNKLTDHETDSLFASVDFILDKMRDNETMYQWYITDLLNKYEERHYFGLEPLYVYMVEHYISEEKSPWLDNKAVRKLKANAAAIKPTLIGEMAPDFTAIDSSGQNVHLSDIKDGPIILFFWNPLCPSCKKLLPGFRDLAADEKLYNTQLITLNMEEDPALWQSTVKDYELNQKNIHNWDISTNHDLRRVYNISVTPTILILKEDGTIWLKQVQASQLRKILRNYYRSQNN